MTITRVGASEKYSSNWADAFGEGKTPAKKSKSGGASKKAKAKTPAAKSAKKKPASPKKKGAKAKPRKSSR